MTFKENRKRRGRDFSWTIKTIISLRSHFYPENMLLLISYSFSAYDGAWLFKGEWRMFTLMIRWKLPVARNYLRKREWNQARSTLLGLTFHGEFSDAAYSKKYYLTTEETIINWRKSSVIMLSFTFVVEFNKSLSRRVSFMFMRKNK